MGAAYEKPFATIESAQEFITLLFDTVNEAKTDVEAEIVSELGKNGSRRLDAMRIAGVHLNNLQHHVIRTKRILNDLRTLRRLLLDERSGVGAAAAPLEALRVRKVTAVSSTTKAEPPQIMARRATA